MKGWWQTGRWWRMRRVVVLAVLASLILMAEASTLTAVASTLTAVTSRLPDAPLMTTTLAVRALRPTSWKQAVGKNSHRRG